MTEITAEEARVYKETFAALDRERTGKISLDQIGYALRINNQCPSEEDIQAIINSYMDVDEDGTQDVPQVDFDEFCTIMKENSKTREELQEKILEAFLSFDKKETGLLEGSQLREIMTTMGETLEESEINEMIKDANCGTDGKIAYEEFARHMLDSYSRPKSKKKSSAKKSGRVSSRKSTR